MSFLKSCTQCKFYQRGYCSFYSRNVFSTGEAQLCPNYSVVGFVNIGPIDSLSGQLVEYQIPSGIISTLKLADLAVTSAKLANDAVTLVKIADGVITNAKIDAAAAIVESKLSLAYGTQALHDDILLRQLSSEKDVANGYLGLDASAKVPLSKLNPLTNTEIAAAAAIAESKLNLAYGTQDLHDDIQTRVLAATYAAHDHSLADPTQVNHANLINVLADQHHPQAHTLASHTTKAHSELTGVGANDHHNRLHSLDSVDDHSGTLSWSKVNKTGSSLTDLATRAHSNLTGIGASDHHSKTTSISELTDHTKANHDALGLDHASLSNVLASQHHTRYADNEAVSAMGAKGDSNPLNHDKYTDTNAKAACVSNTAFSSSWNAITDISASKNAIFDAIRQRLSYPIAFNYWLANGAIEGCYYGSAVYLPPSDIDCRFDATIIVPDVWITGVQTYLKVLYAPLVANQPFSGKWSIGAHKSGETSSSYNILNDSTGYDFASQTAIGKLGTNSIDCGTTIEAGDRVGIKFLSDASNSTGILIFGMWLSW